MSSLPPVEIYLRSMAVGGDAVGNLPDGRSIFIPYGLPGDFVRVEVVEEKPRYARGKILQILTPAPERIPPPCRHFGACGGCDYQHIPYERQLEIKKSILKDQLGRIAGIQDAEIRDCIPSPQVWNYRNHVQFHLDEKGQLGFREARSKSVIAIEECLLPVEGIQSTWPGLTFEPGVPVKRIGVREGQPGDVQVILEGDARSIPEMSVEELPISVVHLDRGESVVLAGSEWVVYSVMEKLFRVSAGSFFQVNTLVARQMIDYVLKKAIITQGATLLELYCGVGLFSSFLAGEVERLVAVESSISACEDFVFNLDEFDNVELYEGRVEDVLASLVISPQIILMDPPRSGIGISTMERIARLGAGQIIYISCDPSTLARDAKVLKNSGYLLGEITPFDMFPQTAHIESISIWQKKNT